MDERWLPVVGAEIAYEISDCGRCRSLDRVAIRSNGGTYPVAGRTLRPTAAGNPNKNQHYMVTLHINGEIQRRYIHIMMLEAFVGPRPAGMQGLHWDDDSFNNLIANLRWGTKSENAFDKVRNGRDHQTVKTKCPHGHEYTPGNTLRWGVNGGRRCRQCETDRVERRRSLRAAGAGR